MDQVITVKHGAKISKDDTKEIKRPKVKVQDRKM